MPTYEYYCDPDDEGCGHVVEVTCSMDSREENRPKSCPECRKRKSIRQLFGVGGLHIPHTLGSLVDKNSDRMSEDEKQHLNKKHNEYKEDKGEGPSWISTDQGMVHRDSL